MRSQRYEILAAFMYVLGIAIPCFAQPQPGPATLEGLANAGEAQEAPAAAESESANAGPKPPAGTAVRPEDGVQHPDLDKAWAEYDATVTKAAEGIKAVISKQFDAAAAKGDLDAAEKWQTALEKFEKTGEVPADAEAKASVSAAVAEYKKAKDTLAKTYDSVVKALTMVKNIAEAKAVRDEWRELSKPPDVSRGPESTAQKLPSRLQRAPKSQVVSFDYSTQNGVIVVGTGAASFGLSFTKASDTSIYIYRDHPSIARVARAKNILPGEMITARNVDSTSRTCTIQENEVFLAQNKLGFWLQGRVLEIKDDSRRDDRDEVTFEYVIYPSGQESFEVLPVR